MKQEILNKIKEVMGNPAKGRNSMGVSEAYYNSYYLVGSCFSETKLLSLREPELKNLIILAEFAGNVFY